MRLRPRLRFSPSVRFGPVRARASFGRGRTWVSGGIGWLGVSAPVGKRKRSRRRYR